MEPRIKQINPELEALRKQVDGPPDIGDILEAMIDQSHKIHASFLFAPEGLLFRQRLCILLSATKSSNLYGGWEELGNKLNIHTAILQCIKYNFQHEDPASNTLLAYIQYDSAFLSNIVEALYDIKRYDIIFQLKDIFLETCTKILLSYNPINDCIKPTLTVECPFIFKDITNMYKKMGIQKDVTQNNLDYTKKLLQLPLIKEAIQTSIPTSDKKQNYDKTVLLSFSKDGTTTANAVAAILRKPRNNSRIGVVLLEEQIHKVNLNPEQFVFECFSQVDYIIPIITEEYIQTITSSHNEINSALGNADNNFVKYIYTLMNTSYLKWGCKNYKVRSFIPDEKLSIIMRKSIMVHPLFQVWFKVSELENIYTNILNSKF